MTDPTKASPDQFFDGGWCWMAHPDWNIGNPIPVFMFAVDGERMYVPLDPGEATQFGWDDRDDDWEMVRPPMADAVEAATRPPDEVPSSRQCPACKGYGRTRYREPYSPRCTRCGGSGSIAALWESGVVAPAQALPPDEVLRMAKEALRMARHYVKEFDTDDPTSADIAQIDAALAALSARQPAISQEFESAPKEGAQHLVDQCAPFLKEDETPAECIERNRKDVNAALSFYNDAQRWRWVRDHWDDMSGWKIEPTQIGDELSIVPPLEVKDGQMIQPRGVCVAAWSVCDDSRILYALARAVLEKNALKGRGEA